MNRLSQWVKDNCFFNDDNIIKLDSKTATRENMENEIKNATLELEKVEEPSKKSKARLSIKDLDKHTKNKVIKELQKDIKDLEKLINEDGTEENENNIITFRPKPLRPRNTKLI